VNAESNEPLYRTMHIGQENKAGHNSEVTHRHEEKASQDGIHLHTAMDVFADVVEGFEVKDAAVKLGSHLLCLLQRSGKPFELGMEVFFGHLSP